MSQGSAGGSRRAVVAGAGAAGVFSALALQRRGVSVRLLDPFAPGHLRGASCGHHRILRASHGADDFYLAWSRRARDGWRELEAETGEVLFVENGFVAFASDRDDSWEAASREHLERSGIPHEVVMRDQLAQRLPGVDLDGIAYGLWEPEGGFLYAQRAIIAGVRRFCELGGRLERARIFTDCQERPTIDGAPVEAEIVVCACGAWLPELFPRSLGPMLRIVRQDAILVAPPAGRTSYDHQSFPAFMDRGCEAYGVPATEGLGFKAAKIWSDQEIDLDRDDRIMTAHTIAVSRRYLATRFPELAERPLVGQEVGQTVQTADSNFVIAPHPEQPHVLLVGGDSGHLFKHAPALGEHVAELALGLTQPHPRLGVASREPLARAQSPL